MKRSPWLLGARLVGGARLLSLGRGRRRQRTRAEREGVRHWLDIPADIGALTGALHSIVELSYDAFVAMDDEGIVRGWNRRAEYLFGWSRAEAVGRPLPDIIMPARYRQKHRLGLRHYRATGHGPALNRLLEVSALRRDGTEFPVELTITPIRLDGIYIFGAFMRDISERKQTEREIRTLAFYDTLTGLPNRMLFQAQLRDALGWAERNGHLMALLFLDLDRFKEVNDTLGHGVGDRLLRERGCDELQGILPLGGVLPGICSAASSTLQALCLLPAHLPVPHPDFEPIAEIALKREP